MRPPWTEAALVLAVCCHLAGSSARRFPCRWCHNVSHVWTGTAYKCGFCPRVPHGLPANLTWLHLLAFQSTSLTSYALNAYRQLIDLRLSDNVLSDVPPSTFKRLHHLRRIYLSGNRLTEVPQVPRSVRVLHVQGNNISRLPVLYMPHMQDFVADRNNIDKIEWRVFKFAPSLSLLSLADNRLELLDLVHVLALQVLNVERNRLVQFPRLPLGVVAIYLDWNQIVELPELILYELEELHLAHNAISYVSNTTFLYTPKLRLLDLSQNPLTAVSHDALTVLNAQARIDLTPIAEVIVPPRLHTADDMSSGYMWVVGVVSSFAFLSALLVALVVVLLTKLPTCSSTEATLAEDAQKLSESDSSSHSDEEQLVVTGSQPA